MPKGLKKIDQLAKEAKARSDAYESGEGLHRALYLKDGETARGRFCEEGEGIWYLYIHPRPKQPGQKYNDQVLCLDQAMSEAESVTYQDGSKKCYACEIDGVPRSVRVVINFIRYDEPKLIRDAQGKVVKTPSGDYAFDGVEPALLVCNFATGAGGRMSYLEAQYGPMTNHVCTIHKTGDKNNPFMIDVVEPNKPVDAIEKSLYEKKLAPPEVIRSLFPRFKSIPLMSYADMQRVFAGASVPSSFSDAGNGQGPQDNIYAQAANEAAGRGHLNLGAFSS